MNSQRFKKQFFAQLREVPAMFRLFEYLPDIMFFMKDVDGRIVAASQNFVLQMGGQCEADILGKTAFDLCPDQLARQYTEDDQLVMRTRRDIVHHLELNQSPDGTVSWFVTHKVPVYGKSGAVIGLAGITRDILEAQVILKPYDKFSKVVEHIHRRFADRIRIPALAELTGMSVSQFERRFKQVFGSTPSRYVLRVRIARACRELTTTSKSIAMIAHETGFSDQSALTRYFRQFMGVAPGVYRRSVSSAR